MGSRVSNLPEMNHLQKKILITLGLMALYRVGVHIPIPGVDTDALQQFFASQGGNFFGMFNMILGGALERFSVFAIGVMPYISASIIFQLLTVVWPPLEQLSKEGESGRKKITQYTRYATIVLALIQGFMLTNALSSSALTGQSIVLNPTLSWKLMTTLSLTAGTAFLMWLGEQITERGVGNGISLIIFAGIVAGLPSVVQNTYEKINSQELTIFPTLALIVVCLLVVAAVVFMEQSARKIPVQYAKRQQGRVQFGNHTTDLPIKINSAGVIPPIFASSILQFPLTIVGFYPQAGWADFIQRAFIPGGWVYNAVYMVLIIFFAYFYTSITFKPDDIAENLKKHGGFIPGIRPGTRTAEYLAQIISRLTLIGSIYLAAVCVLPTIITDRFNVQFYFGGTSLLIVVGVALDTFRQIEAHRQSLRYDAFMSQSMRSKGRRNPRPR